MKQKILSLNIEVYFTTIQACFIKNIKEQLWKTVLFKLINYLSTVTVLRRPTKNKHDISRVECNSLVF